MFRLKLQSFTEPLFKQDQLRIIGTLPIPSAAVFTQFPVLCLCFQILFKLPSRIGPVTAAKQFQGIHITQWPCIVTLEPLSIGLAVEKLFISSFQFFHSAATSGIAVPALTLSDKQVIRHGPVEPTVR